MNVDSYEMNGTDGAYLHDATVQELVVKFPDTGVRKLSMDVTCHEDCGRAAWNGRRLRIEFVDTSIVVGEFFGITADRSRSSFALTCSSTKLNAGLSFQA